MNTKIVYYGTDKEVEPELLKEIFDRLDNKFHYTLTAPETYISYIRIFIWDTEYNEFVYEIRIFFK